MGNYKFSDEDREEVNQSMPFGVSKVQLVMAEAGETDAGKEFIELHVSDANGVEDSARVWFVGGAAKFSFNTLRDILVHQGKTEEEKDAIRTKVNDPTVIDGPEAMINMLNEYIGGELWFTKYYDAEGKTYTNQYGTFPNINKNIYGYEPTEKPELMKPVGGAAVVNTVGGAEDLTNDKDAAGGIPKSW